MPKKMTNIEFAIKANNIHNNKYSYEIAEYVHGYSRVKIICPIHGIFEQTPNKHFRGRGCPHCGGTAQSNTSDYIIKARKVHGDTYDYSLVDYKKAHNKVKIICKKHGQFEQLAGNHLDGKGCLKCGGRAQLNSIEFIERAKEVHSDRYDYSNVQYINIASNVSIICKEHGLFNQNAYHHLSGHGCPSCTGTRTTQQFIEKAKRIHSNNYDYSLVDYVGAHIKVKIICPTHGIFEQEPSNHIHSVGCPSCNSSKGEVKVRCALESLGVKYEPQYRTNECRNIFKLPFDFAIFHDNRLACIEYQGQQHYIKTNFNGKLTEEKMGSNLASIQLRDNIKKQYCLDNNIPLLVLKYTQDRSMNDRIKTFVEQFKNNEI